LVSRALNPGQIRPIKNFGPIKVEEIAQAIRATGRRQNDY
jgi:hypothetical protein